MAKQIEIVYIECARSKRTPGVQPTVNAVRRKRFPIVREVSCQSGLKRATLNLPFPLRYTEKTKGRGGRR